MEALGKLLSGRERPASPISLPPSSTAAKAGSGRRFAVGFSFAGEDRARVAPVAEELARRFGRERVLFDRFHEAELARPDLDVYLPRLYRDETELIVVLLSPDYPGKRWCGLEWRWIRQLILSPAQERIMLLRVGDPGDLSELGIVAGDGFLDVTARPTAEISARILERMAQQGIPIPEAADPGLNSGAAARPLPLLKPLPPRPWWPPPRRTAAALLVGAALALPMAWFLGRPQLARWQLQQGDQAFLAYAKVPADGARLQQAGAAWQQARLLDPHLAAAHARLGFLADFLDDPVTAEAAWKRAIDLERASTPQAKAYRNGLANVLAQQPARRQEALQIYDGDNDDPRSAIEAAMQRWPRPTEQSRALDAASRPDLAESLAGKATGAEPPWGFKLPEGDVILFETRAERRCLLGGVRAATVHLAGEEAPAPPLAAAVCQGIQSGVKDLLCSRLEQARDGNPRAAATGRWLGCPPTATRMPATDGGTVS